MPSEESLVIWRKYSHLRKVLSPEESLVIWGKSCHLRKVLSSEESLVIWWKSCHLRKVNHLVSQLTLPAPFVFVFSTYIIESELVDFPQMTRLSSDDKTFFRWQDFLQMTRLSSDITQTSNYYTDIQLLYIYINIIHSY